MTSKRTGIVLYLLAAIAYVALITWGPNSDPPRSLHLLLGFAAIMCIAGLVSAFATPRDFTLMTFAAIGATLGIAVFGIFGIGLYGLIPPVLIIVGTWILRDRLDGGMAIPATATCCIAMISPLLIALI